MAKKNSLSALEIYLVFYFFILDTVIFQLIYVFYPYFSIKKLFSYKGVVVDFKIGKLTHRSQEDNYIFSLYTKLY